MTMQAQKIKSVIFSVMLLAATSLVVSGCAGSRDYSAGYKSGEISDPLEPVNRVIFGFNTVLDRVLIEPAAKVYRAVTPQVMRDSVQSFMRNLKAPVHVANNLLQGDVGGAGVSTARFLINTTVGVGGLVDVAAKQGLAYEPEDFGQTMAKWGVGSGPYLVLPVLGPSSLRDTGGLVVDVVADPVNIWATNTDREWIAYTRAGVEGVDARSRVIEALQDMRRNSLDFYAAMRSAYVQRRAALIADRHPSAVADFDEDF